MLLAAALALAPGCASGGGGGGAAGETTAAGDTASPGAAATIVIDNAEPSGPTYSISLESSGGERMMLGSVAPQATETFEVPELAPATSWRLVAARVGGGDIASERFPLQAGGRVHWTLPYNTLRSSP